jgi:thiol-disulfide isomerase/thioredoxin
MKHALLFGMIGIILLSGCTQTTQRETQPVDAAERIYSLDPVRAMIGKEIPQLEFTDLVSGNKITSSDLKTKVVLVNSFLIGCPSCLAEIPKLNQLHEKYGNRVMIVQLDINPDDNPEKLLRIKNEQNGADNVWTIAPTAAQQLNMKGPDYTYIIKNGKITYADSFVVPVERLERFIDEALQ